ncbi:alpha/beta hydrolase [Streptomyces sp. DG2A-72]|uniref:alpha/beta fold hydrolase n=1 Tax=Streptomyces sp. DG2A-72 TaxID=3051386 RepID=UPI00265BB169|nr:alpha/beta hydrolase [Streptomyces sp. DG2A-72]MDO0936406.1 alpha/beta hydrolase [Streptomyces sp. DG2A-72]
MSPSPYITEVLTAFAADGTPLAVYRDAPARPRPEGTTIVLVHGASVTADLWRLHARHLTGLGFSVVRYDQRAHGHTPRGRAPLTIEQLADDLNQILLALAPTGPLVLAGHSLGALVLQELTALQPQLLPRIRGMVLLSATARGAIILPGRSPRALLLAAGRSLFALACTHAPQAVDRVRRLLPDTNRYTLTPRPNTGPGDRPPSCRHGVTHTPTADLATLWQSLRDYRARHLPGLEQLGGRLLLIAGADDRHIPAAHTAQLADRLPSAGLELLPRTTHALPIRHPALISARIAHLAVGPHPHPHLPQDPSFPNSPLSEQFH